MPGIGMGAVGAAGAVGVDGAATGEPSDTGAPLGAVAILGKGRPSEARRVKSGRPPKLARRLRAEVLERLRLVSRLAHRTRVSVSRSRKARPAASCAAHPASRAILPRNVPLNILSKFAGTLRV